jgi:acetyltransferase
MEIAIRPAMPSDAVALERFYAGLSEESRRRRFFSVTSGISHRQSVSFCTPDHAHREGVVAIARDAPRARGIIVGHLCLEPVDAVTAEVAIAVADDFQHRGIGRRLMTAGIDWARSVGITRLTATVLVVNGPIERLLSGLGLSVTAHPEGFDATVLTIDLGHELEVAA